MSLRIAIDCDEILIESVKNLIQYVAIKYNHIWVYENMHSYMLSENSEMGLTKEHALHLFDEYFTSSFAKNAIPVEGAFEKVKSRRNMGYELFVVTARNEKASLLTHYQIEKYFPHIFSDICFAAHFTENHRSKSAICHEIGAKILVDDNIDYALDAAQHNINTILLERPWNIWRTEEHENILKLPSWSSVDIDYPKNIIAI